MRERTLRAIPQLRTSSRSYRLFSSQAASASVVATLLNKGEPMDALIPYLITKTSRFAVLELAYGSNPLAIPQKMVSCLRQSIQQ
ncbi:hypothetical protein MLPF_2981 [Mycobacterium lepromatosis]|nr:hypothetical protein MLPF_2981 [Mycobacterium lepromatosis]